ncbi:upstream stimulatory factor 2-like protein [Leptotrombidium deliense]|uniref:Upstream stimulatory factor 2-like protein n=1 Tax=Leptotrombidium deliense TaxID=299467 RepID=A0A443S7B4_9ACAR|nr:upstream stimulatory factor 2-like protein [Leptotrombidium deliense]
MDHLLERSGETSCEQDSNSANKNDDEDDNEQASIESNSGDSRGRIDDAPLSVPATQVSITTAAHSSVFDASSVPLQYQLKAENGQVYRVLHIGDIQNNEQQSQTHVVGSQGVAQAIITHAANPFGGTTTTSSSSGDGPFYVMMAPTQEIITPTTTSSRRKITTAEGSRLVRDEKRRATHNEVERRRRDKINNWIMKLAKIVPDCSQDHTKQGQSKGGILAKACEYITDLVNDNSRLHELIKDLESQSNELDSTRQQLMDLKSENRRLRLLLQRHGIPEENT